MRRGIDVSENNGVVDFQKVKEAGYDFVIIRLGYGNRHLDSMFYDNVNKALAADLDIGVYYYDYALDTSRAEEEAEFMLDILEDCGLSPEFLKLGCWYDMEDADGWKARHGMPDNQTITDMCSRFIVKCNERNYSCGIYASYSWLVGIIDTDQLADYVPYWNAEWGRECSFPRAKLWQYTSSAIIDGHYFDANIQF